MQHPPCCLPGGKVEADAGLWRAEARAAVEEFW